ncbi:MAG TPA: M1 family metallopeptidase [Candidatus Acidoferrum sp.]|jgi:aminopeptidase N
MKRFVISTICCSLLCFAAHAQRLPENASPQSYDLTFEPNLPAATFTGDETIHIRLRAPSASIVLNSAEIAFKKVTIKSDGVTQEATVTPNEKDEMVTLSVPASIPAGLADIHIRFTGILNDKLRGFYLSQTARRRYAVTQFEATDARRAFPSLDEPAYKAVFNITLIIDKSDTAISNGHILSDKPGPGDAKHTVTFSPSPKMSSYLVAMMVGDFSCREGAADNIPIRVCAVPEKKELTSYALTSAENILKFYDQYFTVKYPFQKLDIIAFPDFSAGAMENVAAITYRETLLTIDDKTASVDAHQAVVSVLAHEMAHMWFGDLVTMKWWDDVWLNEGFATWMSWKPMIATHPEWHNERSEILETGGALANDSISSVRAIRAKADTTADIQTLFDTVAYAKAASVLRMVEAYVSPEVFRKGANAYLQKHAYANATAEDFWGQMTATSGKPVDKIMKGFTEQSGAPLVSVQADCDDLGKTRVTLSQERYFGDAKKLSAGSSEIWQIPVSLRTDKSKDVSYFLLAQHTQTFDLPGCSAWVFANAGGRGYYRSAYQPGKFAALSAEMEKSFSPEERVHFLGDAWAMVSVGRLNIGNYLATLQQMQSERTRAVLGAMTGHLAEIHDTIVAPADRPAFEAWIRNFLHPIAAELGYTAKTGESDDRRALRGDIFDLLAEVARDPEALAKARELVAQYMKNPDSVDASLAASALAAAARHGDTALYDEYLQHLKTAKTPEEYYNYLGALTLFSDPALLKRTMELALSPAIKNQDLGAFFGALGNYETQTVAWEQMKANFPAVLAKADASLGAGLTAAAGAFCDPTLRDDSQNFFAAQHLPGSERPLENAKDTVNACIELRSLQQPNLSAYLKR